jgi:deoxyribose-phosphate aldolase
MTKKDIARMIDQTQLKPNVSLDSVESICLQARLYDFATVAIHPCHIPLARSILQGSNSGITAALAFPYGAWSAEMKEFEIKDAMEKGATDLDFVINVGALKDKKYDVLKEEAEICRKASEGKILKSILEVCLLTEDEIVKACEIYSQAGVDFVKTSTGFLESPTTDVVKIMHETVKKTSAQVKAAGGIRTAEDARKMVEAGATRLGTSSGMQIYNGWKE